LAAEALHESDHRACVVFARCTENWGLPYDAVLLVDDK